MAGSNRPDLSLQVQFNNQMCAENMKIQLIHKEKSSSVGDIYGFLK